MGYYIATSSLVSNSRIFSYKNALARHIRLHTKEKPYKCSICGEGFNQHWAMRRHRASHKPASLYQCDICSKTFKQKQTLFIHARIHTGHKPYSCEICRKAFTLKSSLNQHLRIHTGERPKVCPVCYKAFRQTSTLNSHMKLHTHIKPHKCRYCKMRFAFPDEVTNHESVHIQNKSWQCDDCGMRFRNQSLLSRHVRKHTNERPFQCKICGKSFSQSGSLQSHMRTHTKEKPYQCRLCPKTYTTSGTLLLHIRRAHGLEAKKVKDVFPSFTFLEDQKVFTIKSQILLTREGASKMAAKHTMDSDGMDGTIHFTDDVRQIDEALDPQQVKLEDVIDGSGVVDEVGKVLTQRINPDVGHPVVESPDQPQEIEMESLTTTEREEVEVVPVNHSSDTVTIVHQRDVLDEKSMDKSDGIEYSTVQELMSKRQIKPCSLTLMNIAGVSRYKIIDVENEKENSLSAQARQEAALGLAELSLVGGVVVSEKRAGAAARTIAREVDDGDTDDPSVTKIILSKEGGVMNSQDPHQCPECGRIFGRKSIMTEHRRIHTDEKPYECDFCSVRFRQSAQLSSHIRNRHTKEKKFQCSFCHNRFLSRNITIRHINFHHKLKVRLCESINPSWTVDEAVWSDEKFQIKTKDLQAFPKHEPVNDVTVSISSNDKDVKIINTCEAVHVLESNTKTLQPSTSIDGSVERMSVNEVAERSIVDCAITVPEEPNESADHNYECKEKLEEVIEVKENCYTVEVQSNKMDTMLIEHGDTSANGISQDLEQTTTLKSSTLSVWQSKTDTGHNVDVPFVEPDHLAVESNAASDQKKDLDMRNSRLVCETCAMQFRGISSLRYHLKKVHDTTLAESDISFVFEGDDTDDKTMESESYPVQFEEKEDKHVTVHRDGTGQEFSSQENTCTDFVSNPQNYKRRLNAGKSNLVCRICSVHFGNRTDLEEHLKEHGIDEVETAGMHRCDVCGVVLKNTQQITKHILKHHGVQNVYGCSICQKEFFQESSVLRHMKFFHKWEMKIRGESNIPVLLKPAPSRMQCPSNTVSSASNLYGSINRGTSHRQQKSSLKVSSRKVNDVTYISLEVGDLDNLHLYRNDGKEVKFQVVSSSEKMKTLRIIGLMENASKETDKINDTISHQVQPSEDESYVNDDVHLECPRANVAADSVEMKNSSTSILDQSSASLQADTVNARTVSGLTSSGLEKTVDENSSKSACEGRETISGEPMQGSSSSTDGLYKIEKEASPPPCLSSHLHSTPTHVLYRSDRLSQGNDLALPAGDGLSKQMNNNQKLLVGVADVSSEGTEDEGNWTSEFLVLNAKDTLSSELPDSQSQGCKTTDVVDREKQQQQVEGKSAAGQAKVSNDSESQEVKEQTDYDGQNKETKQTHKVDAKGSEKDTKCAVQNVDDSVNKGEYVNSKTVHVHSAGSAADKKMKQTKVKAALKTFTKSSVRNTKNSKNKVTKLTEVVKPDLALKSQGKKHNTVTPKGQQKIPSPKHMSKPTKPKPAKLMTGATNNPVPQLSSRGRLIKKKKFADD